MHAPVHADGSADAEGGPGFCGQSGVRPHVDDDEHQVGKGGQLATSRLNGVDLETAGRSLRDPSDALDRGVRPDVDAVRTELLIDQGTKAGIHGREHLGEPLELGDGQPSGPQTLRHFEPDVARTHDHSTGRLVLLERAHQLEGVAHGMEQVHAVGRAEAAPGPTRPSMRGRAGTAPVPTTSWS